MRWLKGFGTCLGPLAGGSDGLCPTSSEGGSAARLVGWDTGLVLMIVGNLMEKYKAEVQTIQRTLPLPHIVCEEM